VANRPVLRGRRQVLAARAAAIRLLLLDVDGVLTDGTILIHADGSESKRFHIRDGSAIVIAQAAGLPVGWLSARPSAVTERRAAELGVRLLVQSRDPKVLSFEQILRRQRLTGAQVAYMGDDLLDLPVLSRAGLSAAPADAAAEVRSAVDYVTAAGGGQGAVREFVEWLLQAQGRWKPGLVEHRRSRQVMP
jgi:3-deoxy-D-manno-octulosonate 8-phosphate phosphatase (KDO 8-P phosphatase)